MFREFPREQCPIDCGSIVIDSYGSGLDPGQTYLSHHRFMFACLSRTRDSTSTGDWAQEVAVQVIIDEEDLPILSPGKWERQIDGRIWGPYAHRTYNITPEAYITHYPAMVEAIAGVSRPLLGQILSDVLEDAHIASRHITDSADPESLPGAFTTPLVLTKLINSGMVLSFRDFQNAGERIRTSPAKYAEVFGKIVEILGDDRARESIGRLKTVKDHTRRRWIRDELYISTESLVQLLVGCGEQVENARLSTKEWSLLRQIIGDRYKLVQN